MNFSQKRTAIYDLASIQAALNSTPTLRMTVQARRGAVALGFSDRDIVEVVQSLRKVDFYKSMTSHADHRVWQGVYHFKYSEELMLYLKFTLDEEGHIVLSFKQK